MAETFCGTGSGNFPQPGDPDLNNSILNAVPAFGGIDVLWTYPELNSHAVAHANLYRSTNADPATRVKLRTVTGEYYYDKVDPAQQITYYYWIQFVSVNGTVGDFIGPASAMARPTIEQTIEMLTGRISQGELAQSMKSEIQRINAIDLDLTSETDARFAQYESLLADIRVYQDDVDGVATLLSSEVARLEDADSAQVSQINVMAAKADDNAAQIVAEEEARVAEDNLIAKSVETLETSMGRKARTFFTVNPPVAENTGDWWIDTDNGNTLYIWVGSDWVPHPDFTGTVFRQTTAPATIEVDALWFDSSDGDTAYRWDGTAWVSFDLYAGNEVTSAIQTNNRSMIGYCRVNGVIDTSQETPEACSIAGGEWLPATPLSEAVKGVQITDGDGESANVEQRMVAYKDDLNVLSAEYTVKVQVDPLNSANKIIGGFGIAVNGNTATVEAGFDVDRFWVGKLGKKTFPFIIEGNEVFMKEAVIQSLTFSKIRSADGSLMFTPAEYDINGNLTQDGTLKAEYIQAGQLDVRDAATFSGTVSSGDFVSGSSGFRLSADGSVSSEINFPLTFGSSTGLKALAGKNTADWGSDVVGTGKPANNADVTGSNTAYDTARVAGYAAATVRDRADAGNSAKTRTDGWTKTGTTLIDGGQIFADEAYIVEAMIKDAQVDTLQIKGQAVTFPRGGAITGRSLLSGSYSTAASVQMTLTGAPIIVHCSALIEPGYDSETQVDRVYVQIVKTGVVVYSEIVCATPGNNVTYVPFSTSLYIANPGSGSQNIYLQFRYSGGDYAHMSRRYVAVLEAKR